jgi:hypothetical protein
VNHEPRPVHGAIPFRVRIGVTGHRSIASAHPLSGLGDEIRRLFDSEGATQLRLTVVSSLAEGADRLVVEEIFADAEARDEEARLEVVLPFRRRRYSEEQEFSPEAEAELADWLDRAAAVTELDGGSDPATLPQAYEAASRSVVSRCDVLVAVWDGEPSRGRGGTAETLLYAAETGRPCIWLPSDDGLPRRDNLTKATAAAFSADVRRRTFPGDEHVPPETHERDTLEPLRAAFREVDAFNGARVSPAKLQARIERELGPVEASSGWIAWPFARAACLADRAQARFVWSTRSIALLAVAAAAALGVSAAQPKESPEWALTEVACLVALIALFVAIRRTHLHARWLSYRVLAERFRSAFFIAPTGIDFRRTVGLETVFVDRRSADWLLRAFEEVWDSRPMPAEAAARLDDDAFARLRRRLADDWIRGQIAFHERARRGHERLARAGEVLIFACFVGTIAFAALRAWPVGANIPMITFSITLPVAAGALGALLTVRQHRALAERYARMHTDLAAVRNALLEADRDTVQRAASEAARVIAEENGDWFGAMWFLDIEHP